MSLISFVLLSVSDVNDLIIYSVCPARSSIYLLLDYRYDAFVGVWEPEECLHVGKLLLQKFLVHKFPFIKRCHVECRDRYMTLVTNPA